MLAVLNIRLFCEVADNFADNPTRQALREGKLQIAHRHRGRNYHQPVDALDASLSADCVRDLSGELAPLFALRIATLIHGMAIRAVRIKAKALALAACKAWAPGVAIVIEPAATRRFDRNQWACPRVIM